MDLSARNALGRDFFISGIRDQKVKERWPKKQPATLAKAYELAESDSYTFSILAKETATVILTEVNTTSKVTSIR